MPQAEPFSTFSLRGSGFPFCIPRVNVTDYEYVAPLKLEQVSHLFYNLAQVNLTGSMQACATNECTDFLVSPTVDDRYYDPDDPIIKPNSRVCSGTGDSFFWVNEDYHGQALLSFGGGWVVELFIETGATEETIGYGFQMGFLQTHVGIVALGREGVAYGSFAQSNDPQYVPGTVDSWWWQESEATNFGGVVDESIEPDTVEIVSLSDAADQNSTLQFVKAAWHNEPPNGTTWETADFESLDFWEYT